MCIESDSDRCLFVFIGIVIFIYLHIAYRLLKVLGVRMLGFVGVARFRHRSMRSGVTCNETL